MNPDDPLYDETDRDEPEPGYEIELAWHGRPMAYTVGLSGLMQTMPQLPPGLYMIRESESGRLVADATRLDDGSWVVEFYSGVKLSPGCIIV